MANFRTEFLPSPSTLAITHKSRILTLGSCFADVLGRQLTLGKFPVTANPFGVLFHPEAIFNLLKQPNDFYKNHFLERDGLWFNYSFHSGLNANSLEELYEKIRNILAEVIASIQSTSIMVITLGTAYGYRNNNTGIITGNCHKMPAQMFTKEFTDPETIERSFNEMDILLKAINPSLEYILTVSPVRHLKDTLVLNAASKSSLRLACHHLSTRHPHVHYFPSYEIQLDDLRDYRFYKEDMIHPSAEAEQYIWEKFTETYCPPETLRLVAAWDKIRKALQHKPFHPHTPSHKKFLNETIEKIQELGKFIPVDDELHSLYQQLEIKP